MYPAGRKERCYSAIPSLTQRRKPPRLLSAKDIRSSLHIHESMPYRTQYAYVTLVSTEEFLPGALLLGWSLRKTGTNYDCIAMVVPEITRQARAILRKIFSRVVEVESIKTNRRTPNLRFLPLEDRAEFSHRLTRCNVFKFIEYEKVLFIENNVYAVRKIDELFQLQAPAGISSLVDSSSQTKLHGISLSSEHTTKALDMSRGIRGSILLLTPSISLYQFCHTFKRRHSYPHFIRPDEEFMTKLFLGQWTHIDSKFATVPWQANKIRCDIYGICLESFRWWKDDCRNCEEARQWRLEAIRMTKDIPQTRGPFRNMVWFKEIEQNIPASPEPNFVSTTELLDKAHLFGKNSMLTYNQGSTMIK
eukprot:gene638-10342_t